MWDFYYPGLHNFGAGESNWDHLPPEGLEGLRSIWDMQNEMPSVKKWKKDRVKRGEFNPNERSLGNQYWNASQHGSGGPLEPPWG